MSKEMCSNSCPNKVIHFTFICSHLPLKNHKHKLKLCSELSHFCHGIKRCEAFMALYMVKVLLIIISLTDEHLNSDIKRTGESVHFCNDKLKVLTESLTSCRKSGN